MKTGGVPFHTIASVCVADGTIQATKGVAATLKPADAADVKVAVTTAYTASLKYRSTYGLAKDGRPIYTPMYAGSKTYEGCEVDVCNGMLINGHYAYVATLFHPYFLGCYGPGGKAEGLSQSCSANPRICAKPAEVKKSATARALSVLSIVGLIASLY